MSWASVMGKSVNFVAHKYQASCLASGLSCIAIKVMGTPAPEKLKLGKEKHRLVLSRAWFLGGDRACRVILGVGMICP